ncbi:hypothetical protein F4824DRAFT_506683 [Ustulina deusta]|nr:hypothetical protein F4824DRAFT_506683 [Ustulina deusta]
MLSLSSLLNPAPPGPSNRNGFPLSPELSSPTDSCAEESAFPDRSAIPKHKMPKDAAVFTKGKPKGAVNFQPYENLDEVSLHQTRIFQVYPLGKIREYSRHIPYNSGKKDFFEKTGRESFEVFQYVFKVPGDDAEYAVMWDYNVGLVRMTPFFKCCKYPKTTPAKMLNLNPGLKEITHSITGGSIMAQGYWMPYQCAKAVCATFCHKISGALIPIFGPDFPALCIQVDAPECSRMVIDPAIVIQSTREAEHYRRLYRSTASVGSGSRNDNGNTSPKRDRRGFRAPYDDGSRNHPRYRVRKTCVSTPGSENSPYTTDTDGEISPAADRMSLVRDPPHRQLPRFLHSPIPSIAPLRPSHASSSGWTPANAPHPPAHLRPPNEYQSTGPSPWLSAIPRFTSTAHLQTSPYPSSVNASRITHPQPYPAFSQSQSQSQSQSHPQPHHHRAGAAAHRQLPSPSDAPPQPAQSPREKRPAAHIEDAAEHHGPKPARPSQHQQQQQQQLSRHYHHHHHANRASHAENRSIVRLAEDGKAGNSGADKKAALLLMNLSVAEPLSSSSSSSSTSSRRGRKPRDADRGADITSGIGADRRRRGDAGNLDGGGGWDSRFRADGGGMAGMGGDGASRSPLYGVFPRIKRVRSNSM